MVRSQPQAIGGFTCARKITKEHAGFVSTQLAPSETGVSFLSFECLVPDFALIRVNSVCGFAKPSNCEKQTDPCYGERRRQD